MPKFDLQNSLKSCKIKTSKNLNASSARCSTAAAHHKSIISEISGKSLLLQKSIAFWLWVKIGKNPNIPYSSYQNRMKNRWDFWMFPTKSRASKRPVRLLRAWAAFPARIFSQKTSTSWAAGLPTDRWYELNHELSRIWKFTINSAYQCLPHDFMCSISRNCCRSVARTCPALLE